MSDDLSFLDFEGALAAARANEASEILAALARGERCFEGNERLVALMRSCMALLRSEKTENELVARRAQEEMPA